jgi:hypothetical protein
MTKVARTALIAADRSMLVWQPRHRASRAACGALLTAAVSALCACLPACSGDYGPAVPQSAIDSEPPDASPGAPPRAANLGPSIAGLLVDSGIAGTFFINDPAPPMCGPDGRMTKAAPIEGNGECPADKNRTGCQCPEVGAKAACWPGKRQNRNHGVCRDGMTTCQSNTEFAPAWGPCDGYVLPTDGATQGPEACRCFSNGSWALDNLVPCINASDTNNKHYIYSSHSDPQLGFACDGLAMVPPPTPKDPWTASSLTVDCAGQFELCYTMKSGTASDPKPDDCSVMHACVDVWYEQAGKSQALPSLPGWVASNAACVEQFVNSGGYGEMSVLGKSAECDAVDDGHGKPLVFMRTSYCPSDCATNPTRPGCGANCGVSGSGKF